MTNEYLFLAFGAAFAGFIQGIAGFAFSMVAMSIWVWGVDPKLASAVAIFGGLSGQILAVVNERKGLDFALLKPFLLGAVFGLPVGALLLPFIAPLHFKFVLGVALTVCCPLMMFAKNLPPVRLQNSRAERIADGVVGAIGGLMSVFGGFSGVAPALWCTLRRFDKDKQRAIAKGFNLVALGFAFVATLASGSVSMNMLPAFPIVLFSLIIPSLVGQKIYAHLKPDTFRLVLLSVLTVSGIAMISATAPKLLG